MSYKINILLFSLLFTGNIASAMDAYGFGSVHLGRLNTSDSSSKVAKVLCKLDAIAEREGSNDDNDDLVLGQQLEELQEKMKRNLTGLAFGEPCNN